MATNGKAYAQGSATHPARVLRNVLAALVGQPAGTHANSVTPATSRLGSYGVVGDDLNVTTTGGLGYSVAAGRLVATGTFAAYQGAYAGYNDAAVTGSFSARHATLSRTDLVCYRVRDTDEDATGSEDDGIVIVEGTAGSGTPAVPSSLGSLVVLSQVTVPSAADGSTLTFADRRPKLTALGGVVPCTSSSRPTGGALRESTHIYETDTKRTWKYNGSTWVPVSGRFGVGLVNSGGSVPAASFAYSAFTSSAYDTDSYNPSLGNTITVPAGLGGVYAISAYSQASGAPVNPSLVTIEISGGDAATAPMAAGTTQGATASVVAALAAGTNVRVKLYNGHTSTLNYNVSFNMARMSE